MAYIPSQALAGLRNYRYKGVDKYVSFVLGCIGAIAERRLERSFLSNYVLNPFWTWFVTLWPTWVAPNVVCTHTWIHVTGRSDSISVDNAEWASDRAVKLCVAVILRSYVSHGEGWRDGPAKLAVLYVRCSSFLLLAPR
jgi:hypothetical protein